MYDELSQRFMRLPEVQSKTGLSRSHIYDLITRGEFPRQYKLGGRVSGWLESEVSAWIKSKITTAPSSSRGHVS
jgi:prophage regulatory protein